MRIRIHNAQDLDELSLTLQKILAHLEDAGVASADRINLYLTPLKPSGDEKTLAPEKLDSFEILADQPAGSKGRGGGKGYRNTRKR